MNKLEKKNLHSGQHVWLVSDNTYLSELYLRSCDRPAYEILEGMIREKNQKNVKVEVASERIDNLLNFMLDGERDTEFGIKEADYGNRVLCTSREDAEKYIDTMAPPARGNNNSLSILTANIPKMFAATNLIITLERCLNFSVFPNGSLNKDVDKTACMNATL